MIKMRVSVTLKMPSIPVSLDNLHTMYKELFTVSFRISAKGEMRYVKWENTVNKLMYYHLKTRRCVL